MKKVKTMKAKIEYLKKNFDQVAVLGVMTKITLGQFSELTINDKLNINKNGILYLEKELITEILEYKFFIPLL